MNFYQELITDFKKMIALSLVSLKNGDDVYNAAVLENKMSYSKNSVVFQKLL